MLSIIHMHKNKCITKEKFLNDYQTNKESDMRKDLSVGEDLETYIKRGLEYEGKSKIIELVHILK